LRKISTPRREEQGDTEHDGNQSAGDLAADIEIREGEERERCRGHAAGGEAPDHAPLNVTADPMNQRAAGLGGGGVEKIGADGRRRVDAEQQDQQRRHERAAAHAGHTHQHAHAKSRQGIEQIERVHDSPGCG
jgi:hypothetical protein